MNNFPVLYYVAVVWVILVLYTRYKVRHELECFLFDASITRYAYKDDIRKYYPRFKRYMSRNKFLMVLLDINFIYTLCFVLCLMYQAFKIYF